MGLLLLASISRRAGSAPQQGPIPTPPPGATTRRKVGPFAAKAPPIRAKPIRTDPYKPPANPVQIVTSAVPAAQAPEQAAVDAAVSQAIRQDLPMPPTAATNVPVVPGGRNPKDAAKALLAFLLRTGRFGTLKDQPQEVKDAQRDLGVKADGIVGPKTRAAARKQGVALPPIK